MLLFYIFSKDNQKWYRQCYDLLAMLSLNTMKDENKSMSPKHFFILFHINLNFRIFLHYAWKWIKSSYTYLKTKGPCFESYVLKSSSTTANKAYLESIFIKVTFLFFAIHSLGSSYATWDKIKWSKFMSEIENGIARTTTLSRCAERSKFVNEFFLSVYFPLYKEYPNMYLSRTFKQPRSQISGFINT